jgi:pyruvate dehydrogenase E2 component (dihydrolipoamide acetyltransferase)
MSESVSLPALGESVTEGTVTRWLKSVGDHVDVDEPLLEVSTDKVDTEIPSPVSGVVEEILVQEDETIEVGTVLVRIGDGSGVADTPTSDTPDATQETTPETVPSTVDQPHEQPVQEQPAVASPASSEVSAQSHPEPPVSAVSPVPPPPQPVTPGVKLPESSSGDPIYVTPLVRKLAHQTGIDLSTITGTGIGGRIRKQDLLDAQSSTVPSQKKLPISPLRGTTVPMSRLRKVVAERAVESMQTTAQLTSVVEADVTKIARLRDATKATFLAKTGVKLSFLPFFAKACAEALQAFPIINASVDGDSIVYPEQENVSIAVDTERGLLTPVLRDAGSHNIAGLATQIADLAARTRENKLKPDELAGGTFTLTNTGSRGALFDTPVVFLPQSAILGTGIVTKKPVVIRAEGQESIAIRSTVYLALSYDHRIVDGADAARFLVAVKNRLEDGEFEADLGI